VVLQPRALPKGWRGLGCSGFARRYFRNRDCFLLLRVLRWFTSPGSPRRPMDSDGDDGCSHPSGSPIRTSPDHSLLAAPRGLSQLATSFFACLRLGIHTHALSSLTIKSTYDTVRRNPTWVPAPCGCPSVFSCQRSESCLLPFSFQRRAVRANGSWRTAERPVVGLGRVELPTSPLSGVRSSHLSYRPTVKLVELIGIEPTTSCLQSRRSPS
jgi:hypothetical protein